MNTSNYSTTTSPIDACRDAMAAMIAIEKYQARLASMACISRIYVDAKLGWKQFRFPRSKKKRIRKKWEKDRRNWKHTSDMKAHKIDDMLVVSPEFMEELKKIATPVTIKPPDIIDSIMGIPIYFR